MNGNVSFWPSPLCHCLLSQMGKRERTIEFMAEDVRSKLKCILKTGKGWLSEKSIGFKKVIIMSVFLRAGWILCLTL